MKKFVLFLFIGMLPVIGFAQVNLVRWVSSNLSATIDNGQITASDITVNGGISLTSVSWGAADTFFSTSPGTYASTINTAIYRQFQMTAISGYTVTPSTFSFKGRNQGGTSKIEVRYSKLADFSSYGTFAIEATNTSTNYINYDLNFPANYTSAVSGSIYVRVYIYDAYNNFHFNYQPGTYDGPTFKGTLASASITAVNDVVNVSKNTVTDINVLSNDFPGSGTFTTVGSLSTPTNSAGTVSVNADKTIKFTPTAGYLGTSTFNYTVSNSMGGSSQAQVQITITEPALAEWGFTTNGSVTSQQSYVTANAVQITGITPSYSIAGMALANFSASAFEFYRFFDIKLKPNTGKTINVTNLVFDQERLSSGSINGPSDYQIKYKVVTGAFSEGDESFFNTATVLVAGEPIVSNPSKNIPLTLTLNSNQTLVVRFYAKGTNDYNFAGWRIKANTLKLRGNEVCIPQGNPATSSTNFWTGYVYTWTGTPAATNYIGYVEENETFDRTNNTAISGRGTNNGRNNLCSTPSDYFLVRYKMSKTFTPGTYTFTVGGDDGYRLSLDNGATWIVEDYTDHGYSFKTTTVCLTGTAPTVLLLEYYERAGDSRVSFSYAAGGSATAPTQIAGNSTSCSGTSLTLTASGGTGTIYQWGTGAVGTNIINNQTGASLTVMFNNTTTYWVRRVIGACGETTETTAAISKTVTLVVPTGDPSQFGINTWNVYAFNGQSFTPTIANYFGYYTQNTLAPDTQDTANNGWNSGASPSSSAGWNGCAVPVDQFTFIHKRKGFPSGSYRLIVRDYDDATRILINGQQIRNYASWYGGGTTYTDELGVYCFDANTTIEVITQEAGGNANFKMNIVPVNAIYANSAWNDNANPNDKSVEIQNNLIVNDDLTVCSCTVKTGTTLTIAENKTFTVIGDVVVEGTGKIIVENNGSFIQINDYATFTGATNSFEMKRNTQPVFKYDYTYWSSPIKADAGFTLKTLSPATTPTRYMKWKHTTTPQAWEVVLNGNEVMVPGRGYIVRAPTTFNLEGAGAAQVYNAAFIGHPNNGQITHAVTGSTTVSAFNLIGNPYPSALDATKFLDENSQILGGTLYFWTHNTEFANATSYSYTPSDYASWNRTGGTATKGADGNENDNKSKPTGYIAAGQAFFVKGTGDGAGTAVFNNTMRVAGSNNQFFKPGPTQPVENWQTTGKHRVWLNLTSEQNDFNQALVGYIENATNQLDKNFDGEVFSGGTVSLYSIADTKKFTIQGRALPFSNHDEVPLGYKTTLTGTLKISIEEVDGLLAGKNIYIKDNVSGLVHNLKDSDYTFNTVPGTFDDRFILRYLPQADLGTNTPKIDENAILVFNTNNQIAIKSAAYIIKQVEIYDIQGRVLLSKNNVNEQMFTTQNLNVNNQVILVKITTENDAVLVKKVIMN